MLSEGLFLFLTINIGTICIFRYNVSKNRKNRRSLRNTYDFNIDEIPTISDEQLNFYIKWTKSSKSIDEIKIYIIDMWKVVKSEFHTYRCIQEMSYLNPRAKELPTYKKIINHFEINKSIKVADVGCCFGQDTRQLILDGIPPNSIYSIDIHDGYWNAGIILFQDDFRLDGPLSKVNRCFHDMTLPWNDSNSVESNQPKSFLDSFDFILLMAVLHTLSLHQQERLLFRIHNMLKNGEGILIGTCVGSDQPGDWCFTPDGENQRYLNSLSTLQDMLHRVGFSDIQIVESEAKPGISKIISVDYNERKRLYLKFSARA